MSPDATVSQFQSTRGWWDLALFFACKLHTSNTRRKAERRRYECGCFYRLSAPEVLPPGAATRVSGQIHGLCWEIGEWAELEKVQKKRRSQRWRQFKQNWCGSGMCVCTRAPMQVHRIQLSPK